MTGHYITIVCFPLNPESQRGGSFCHLQPEIDDLFSHTGTWKRGPHHCFPHGKLSSHVASRRSQHSLPPPLASPGYISAEMVLSHLHYGKKERTIKCDHLGCLSS